MGKAYNGEVTLSSLSANGYGRDMFGGGSAQGTLPAFIGTQRGEREENWRHEAPEGVLFQESVVEWAGEGGGVQAKLGVVLTQRTLGCGLERKQDSFNHLMRGGTLCAICLLGYSRVVRAGEGQTRRIRCRTGIS
jgi:hypothetical protein